MLDIKKKKLFESVYIMNFTSGSAVEQVAAVFAALSDAKETTRQLVVGLVERLAGRLDSVEAENKRLIKDNVSLLQQINKVSYTHPVVKLFIYFQK